LVTPYILALDPSFRNNGWAIIDVSDNETRVVDVGVIKTKKSDKKLKAFAGEDNHRCAQEIARALNAVFTLYKPQLVCAEAQAGSKNSKAAQLMGMNWGIVSAISYVEEVPIIQARPSQVKVANTGKAKASKEEIADAVINRFPELKKLITKVKPKGVHEHIYDAVSVFVACEISTEVQTVKKVSNG